MIRIGFIGAGGMGSTHLASLKFLSEEFPIEVAAIADTLPEKRENAAKLWPEAKLFDDGDKLLENGDYDLVYIAAPSYLHTYFAVAAMEKGCDVFSEKPVCLTEEECRLLEEMAARTKVRFMVGQVVRFMPEYVLLKKLIEEKTYGDLRDIVMQRISGKAYWGWRDWFNDADRSGSVVLDLHIHDLDYLRYVLGEPDNVTAVHAARYDSGMINHIITHMTFGAVPVTCEGVWHVSGAEKFRAQFRADFDHATVDFDGGITDGPEVKITTDTNKVIIPDLPRDDRTINNGMNINTLGAYYTEDRYFIESIFNNTSNDVAPLSEGIASVRLGLKVLASAGTV